MNWFYDLEYIVGNIIYWIFIRPQTILFYNVIKSCCTLDDILFIKNEAKTSKKKELKETNWKFHFFSYYQQYSLNRVHKIQHNNVRMMTVCVKISCIPSMIPNQTTKKRKTNSKIQFQNVVLWISWPVNLTILSIFYIR